MYAKNAEDRQTAFKKYLARLLNMSVKTNVIYNFFLSFYKLESVGVVGIFNGDLFDVHHIFPFASFTPLPLPFYSSFTLILLFLSLCSYIFLFSPLNINHTMYTFGQGQLDVQLTIFVLYHQQEGRNALHYAASSGSDGIVKLLLAKKVDATVAAGVSQDRKML